MESTARLNPLQPPDQTHKVTDTNIEHQPWFHFRTLRKAADLLVSKDGDFLVRESISQLGSYTLVVHWGGETVNFLILSSTRPDGSVKFRLASDAFSTVPELIQHHLRTGYPVSETSPAVLLRPVDRQATSHPAVAHSSIESAVPPSRGSKGRNLTSRLSPSFCSRQSDSQASDTHSAHYLQIMAVVKSILFSSKAAYIPQKLQQYTPAALAAHLTRHDLTLTQLTADRSSASDRLGACGHQRLLMPYNDALRREVWFRHAQVKYLSILAVFGAVSIETRTSVISQLIALARELCGASLRNAFSFMSVMEALMSPQVAALTSTWKALREKFSSIMTVFDLQLKPLSLSYYAGTRDECPPLIPYIQPVVYNLLIGVQDVQPEDISQRDLLASGLDAFLNHFEAAREYTFPRDEISQLQRAIEQEREDSSLTHFLQQNHTKTLLSKIDKKFVNDFELYDCAEILTSILSSLMTDY